MAKFPGINNIGYRSRNKAVKIQVNRVHYVIKRISFIMARKTESGVKRKTRQDTKAFDISESHQIVTDKLPSNKDILSVLFFNSRVLNCGKNIRKSAKLVFEELAIFWQKARIPIRKEQHCIEKIEKLHKEYFELRKNAGRDFNAMKENTFFE